MTRVLTETERFDVEALLENLPDSIPDCDTDADVRETVRTLEEHARFLRRVIGMETREIAGPNPLPVPRTWAEIEEMIRPIGVTAWATFMGYSRAACAEMEWDVQQYVRQAAGVALRMREEFDPSAFPPPDENDFARAWATAVGGLVLKPRYTDEERELVEHPFAEGEE
jgi:hypothetical protein